MGMRIARIVAGIGLILGLGLGTAVTLSAQTNQGQLAGNVLDPSGAVIAGATITAKSEESGTVYTAQSSSAGNYRFPSIQLGRYTCRRPRRASSRRSTRGSKSAWARPPASTSA